MKALRYLLVGVVSLLLVGILGFLYFKTQAVDFARQNQINAYLRELKEIDARWNEQILRFKIDPDKNYNPAANPLMAWRSSHQKLTQEAHGLHGQGFNEGLEGLGKAFELKMQLVEKFKVQTVTLRNSLDEARIAAAGIETMLRDVRQTEAKQKEKWDALENRVIELQTQILRFNVAPEAALAKDIEALLALIRDSEYPDTLRERIAALAGQISVILRQKPVEAQLLTQIQFLSAGQRVDTMARAFDRAFQAAADEKEVYRVYLIFYSGALLIVLAFLGARLRQSYQAINEANMALKALNENLEHLVAERTRELSDALKHLKESETLLIQSEKMSSLGQMVAGVVHEINTPLAYVKSSLDAVGNQLPEITQLVDESQKLLGMLQTGNASEEELAAQFAQVSGMADGFKEHQIMNELATLIKDGLYGIVQISEIVVNLKNFSRLDRAKISSFNLNEGLDSTLLIARNMVKHKEVKKNYGNIPPINCSPSQVNQVFLNLITNAAQAIEDQGGVITLTTSLDGANHVKVEVEDNGHGIPGDVLPKIFDPFYTTKEIGKGTGLGLSIAYKIVEQHGGSIKVDSKVGAGTKFTVTLPIKPPASAEMPV